MKNKLNILKNKNMKIFVLLVIILIVALSTMVFATGEEPDVSEPVNTADGSIVSDVPVEETEQPVESEPVQTEEVTETPNVTEAPVNTETPTPTQTIRPNVTSRPIPTKVPTPNNNAIIATPSYMPTLVVSTATLTPTETPSPTPNFLPDFTPPPAEYQGGLNADVDGENSGAEQSDASAGIVEIEDIKEKKEFQVYDLIKYAAYMFFVLAGVAILYGLICIAALLFFKKDISLDAMRKKRKNKKKDKK